MLDACTKIKNGCLWLDQTITQRHDGDCGASCKLAENVQRHPLIMGSPVTATSGMLERGVDAVIVGIGNGLAFSLNAIVAIFDLGAVLVSALPAIVSTRARRFFIDTGIDLGRHLMFMAQNVYQIVKHALAATVFTLPIKVWQHYHPCPTVPEDTTGGQ